MKWSKTRWYNQEFLDLEVRGRAQLLDPNTITIKCLMELMWDLSEVRIPPLNVLSIVCEVKGYISISVLLNHKYVTWIYINQSIEQ